MSLIFFLPHVSGLGCGNHFLRNWPSMTWTTSVFPLKAIYKFVKFPRFALSCAFCTCLPYNVPFILTFTQQWLCVNMLPTKLGLRIQQGTNQKLLCPDEAHVGNKGNFSRNKSPGIFKQDNRWPDKTLLWPRELESWEESLPAKLSLKGRNFRTSSFHRG